MQQKNLCLAQVLASTVQQSASRWILPALLALCVLPI